MKEIKLTQGKFALVDDADYEWLNQWKWHAHKNYNTWYVERAIGRAHHQTKISMHNLIMNPPEGMIVDHINRNGLDNRRCNLRIATHAQNQLNRSVSPRNKSGFRGVAWRKDNQKWMSYIKVHGKQKHIGFFDTAEQAARAYDAVAASEQGQFAQLNFKSSA